MNEAAAKWAKQSRIERKSLFMEGISMKIQLADSNFGDNLRFECPIDCCLKHIRCLQSFGYVVHHAMDTY